MLGLFLLVLVTCGTCHGFLQCYQCTTSNASDPCVTDIVGLINTSIGIGQKYLKNCTTIRADLNRCMILYKEKDGEIQFYSRDCHNGTYFPKTFESPLFDNILPINQTTCDYVEGTVVCYRPCNGSFCNGPQPSQCDFHRRNSSYVVDEDQECGAVQLFVHYGLLTTNLQCFMMIFIVFIGSELIT